MNGECGKEMEMCNPFLAEQKKRELTSPSIIFRGRGTPRPYYFRLR